jgi:hypothetical protein
VVFWLPILKPLARGRVLNPIRAFANFSLVPPVDQWHHGYFGSCSAIVIGAQKIFAEGKIWNLISADEMSGYFAVDGG